MKNNLKEYVIPLFWLYLAMMILGAALLLSSVK